MTTYTYIIIGAGMTADAAVRGIRELDPNGSILLVGDEAHPPYKRPPLSKGLWMGKPIEKIWLHTAELGAVLLLGKSVMRVNTAERSVLLNDASEHHYQHLLFATGVRPRTLPFGSNEIIYFRNYADYLKLSTLTDQVDDFGIIGGGFIGSELAAALAGKGKKVHLFIPEESIGSKIFPSKLALYINDYFRAHEVDVVVGSHLVDIQRDGGRLAILQENRQPKFVDAIAAGIGTIPNVELARSAGIEVGNGIQVDSYLMTNIPDVFAAGDVAEYDQPILGRRVRVEHEDNALFMGHQAGRNMAGAHEFYDHLPYFYSDLFDLGYEAIGDLSSNMTTIEDWQEPYQKGVIYYLVEDKVKGVLLWNVWKALDKARELISQSAQIKPDDLKGRII